MRDTDPGTVPAAERRGLAAGDSHAPAKKPRRKNALLDGANLGASQAQNTLDVRAALPLHLKVVLNYEEVDALGICAPRTLRRCVATGRIRRCVIRVGRSVRFVKDILIDELRQAED